MYVAYAPELDVSSCATTPAKARKNLTEAVRLFLGEAQRMGTLARILQESGFAAHKGRWEGPKLVEIQRTTVPLPEAHA